jgi:hypothetical protein
VALYIPAGQRRRRTIALVLATLVVGLIAGVLIGRALAPSVEDRVRSVQSDARQTAAGLRVLVLHDEAGAVTNQSPGDGGADVVLARTRTELEDEFARAPWLSGRQRDELIQALDALVAIRDRTSAAFASAAESLAVKIEQTFGVDS